MHAGGAGRWLVVFAIWGLAGCGPSTSATPDAGACPEGQLRCEGVCVDSLSDPNNCGGCGVVCNEASLEFCEQAVCVPPECTPGLFGDCYSAPEITNGVGQCHSGTHECDDRGRWGPCIGEVVPEYEVCGNGVDENCNGEVDEDQDEDGDGFRTCDGDCCDRPGTSCADPALVNPGAFEVAGNDVDDDCDGVVDNPVAACDSGLASNSGDAMDYARAIDLCQTTVESGPTSELRWGVISAELVLADGSGTAAADSSAIRSTFGSTIVPRAGASMTILATGHAAASGNTNPDYAAFQIGSDMGTTSPMPADWLAANTNDLPNAPGCPDPSGSDANDPVMLKLRIRVPTNARSFSLDVNFLSSEYPEWVCSPFNDFFVVLLDSSFSGTPANPADKNLATYTAPDMTAYPVGVNLAYGDTGLFRYCKNGATGCTAGAVASETTTCLSLDEITGTGMDVVNPPSVIGAPGKCGQNNLAGGGTGWLKTSGNVVPGEVIELRIAIWDTSDPLYDSLVIADSFTWSVDASEPGTDVIID